MTRYIAPHRLAQLTRDEGAVYDRLREGSPKSRAKHIDLACKIAVVVMAVVSTALVISQ